MWPRNFQFDAACPTGILRKASAALTSSARGDPPAGNGSTLGIPANESISDSDARGADGGPRTHRCVADKSRELAHRRCVVPPGQGPPRRRGAYRCIRCVRRRSWRRIHRFHGVTHGSGHRHRCCRRHPTGARRSRPDRFPGSHCLRRRSRGQIARQRTGVDCLVGPHRVAGPGREKFLGAIGHRIDLRGQRGDCVDQPAQRWVGGRRLARNPELQQRS